MTAKVITTVGPAKPQRALSVNTSSVTSAEHLEPLLASPIPIPVSSACGNFQLPVPNQQSSPKVSTPPHRLCLETSFTSLQSPSSEHNAASVADSSPCGRQVTGPLAWEFPALMLQDEQQVTDNSEIHDDWFGLAPLATPESLSEVSSISSRASWLADVPVQTCAATMYTTSQTLPTAPLRQAANSSGDDLSFTSARQTTATATSSEEWERASSCRGNVSSDAFVSVKGTSSSSEDSVMVYDNLPTVSESPASLPPCRTAMVALRIRRPASVDTVTEAGRPVIIKQVKFTHVQGYQQPNANTKAIDTSVVLERGSSTATSEHWERSLTLESGKNVKRCHVPCNKNNMFVNASTFHSEVLDNLCRTDNNNVKLCSIPSKNFADGNRTSQFPFQIKENRKVISGNQHHDSITDRQTLESLPLLSNLVGVPDKVTYNRKNYLYPVTVIGKGESSV